MGVLIIEVEAVRRRIALEERLICAVVSGCGLYTSTPSILGTTLLCRDVLAHRGALWRERLRWGGDTDSRQQLLLTYRL